MKTIRRIAAIGDIHGCDNELWDLIFYLQIQYPDVELWHCGDLVDRGPNSGKVVDLVMKHFTGGVMGNHESTLINMWERHKAYGYMPKNPDKARTISQMNDKRMDYIKSLPLLHVMDDLKCVLVHGGLYPKIPLYRQASINNICRLQMLRLSDVDKIRCTPSNRLELSNRWWGPDAIKQPKVEKPEEESRREGFARWYEEYDHDYDVLFGHSVIDVKPKVFNGKGAGRAISLDTGSCFGGFLTAYIYPDGNYVQVPCGNYAKGKNVTKMIERVNEDTKGFVWRENN